MTPEQKLNTLEYLISHLLLFDLYEDNHDTCAKLWHNSNLIWIRDLFKEEE